MNEPILFETVLIRDGAIRHVAYHNERMNHSRFELLGVTGRLDLDTIVHPDRTGSLRCRITYGRDIHSVEYFPIETRKFRSFKIIEKNISYDHKYRDRRDIESLHALRGEADDIIIIRHGLITDTSIANIAFLDGDSWITPSQPLLPGTSRKRHLESRLIREENIRADDLHRFKKMALLNAILDFHIIDNPLFLT